ncbi:DUF1566 domain-containing protein [Sulfurovum sp. NBC37-1]|uniref:Lcl C-terminal domain-containing protein n=1 Tax=Sulfurovum sp. (strain NBC37-1) TaxID=387093 RepID=UPI0001587D3D|nr:DUF1566 domain-containing protein [Sulfurovum sp. NBC37-1]BAF73177.1 conserved hypothetical protein [Sulfurovum sp. NBC37-1]
MSRILMTLLALSAFASAEITMIKDPKTNLMWEDTPHVRETKITQPRAKEYCSELQLGGYSDWRLPTIHELLTIVDYNRVSPAIPKAFSYIEDESFYWTSTRVADEDDAFWGVNFKRGASSKASEYYDRYVRCVRDIK